MPRPLLVRGNLRCQVLVVMGMVDSMVVTHRKDHSSHRVVGRCSKEEGTVGMVVGMGILPRMGDHRHLGEDIKFQRGFSLCKKRR